MTKKEQILDYCRRQSRPVTARQIADALYPGKPQPYVNAAITQLTDQGLLVRDDSRRPYTVHLPGSLRCSRPAQCPPPPCRVPASCPSSSPLAAFNQFWSEFFGREQDYCGALSLERLLALKAALSPVNNLVAFAVTQQAARQLAQRLALPAAQRQAMLQAVQNAPVNANGYDIVHQGSPAFLCEVKANVPAGGRSRYGAAQEREIRKDLHGLLAGKASAGLSPAAHRQALKFFCYCDTGPAVRHAMALLLHKQQRRGLAVAWLPSSGPLTPSTVYVLAVSRDAPVQQPPGE